MGRWKDRAKALDAQVDILADQRDAAMKDLQSLIIALRKTRDRVDELEQAQIDDSAGVSKLRGELADAYARIAGLVYETETLRAQLTDAEDAYAALAAVTPKGV